MDQAPIDPSGPDIHPVTWLAALEPNHGRMGCRALQSIPAREDLFNRTQRAESNAWKSTRDVGSRSGYALTFPRSHDTT